MEGQRERGEGSAEGAGGWSGRRKGRRLNESADTATAEDETGAWARTDATGTEDASGGPNVSRPGEQPTEADAATQPDETSQLSLRTQSPSQAATVGSALRGRKEGSGERRGGDTCRGGRGLGTGLRLETALAGRSHSDEELRHSAHQTAPGKPSKAKALAKEDEKSLTKDGRLMLGVVLSWVLIVGLGLGMLLVFAYHNVRESRSHGAAGWRSRLPCALCRPSASSPLWDPASSPPSPHTSADRSRSSVTASRRPSWDQCQPSGAGDTWGGRGCAGQAYLAEVADWRRCRADGGRLCQLAGDEAAEAVSTACWQRASDGRRFVRRLSGPGLWLLNGSLVHRADSGQPSAVPPPGPCPLP